MTDHWCFRRWSFLLVYIHAYSTEVSTRVNIVGRKKETNSTKLYFKALNEKVFERKYYIYMPREVFIKTMADQSVKDTFKIRKEKVQI